jgi:hypothetical protein
VLVLAGLAITGQESGRPTSGPPQDAGKLEVLWCPMHPNVRSAVPARCPICSMDLVRIPVPGVGDYRLDVSQIPAEGGRGLRGLRFRIRDPASKNVVESFSEVHERLMHLFVVGRDLTFFAHEHPVRAGDGFAVTLDLEPGAYMLITDFLPESGAPQLIHHAIVTPGYAGSPFARTPELQEDLSDKIVDGIRVQLAVSGARAGRRATARFTFADAVTGAPVRDLQPYLGASGHLLAVSADLTQSFHAHPEGVSGAGPEVAFEALFPDEGSYKIWVQIQRGGRVTTAPFVVRVQGQSL